METKLRQALAPSELQVIDESHKHAGHIGHAGGAGHGGETHFKVKVVSSALAGKSRVETHRIINELLAEELKGGVHALAIEARAE
jgi:BolA protein